MLFQYSTGPEWYASWEALQDHTLTLQLAHPGTPLEPVLTVLHGSLIANSEIQSSRQRYPVDAEPPMHHFIGILLPSPVVLDSYRFAELSGRYEYPESFPRSF